MMDFSERKDARVNAVDPLAPGSARKQYLKNKEMLIFNLVSRYPQHHTNKTVRRIVTCFMYLRHSNIVVICLKSK